VQELRRNPDLQVAELPGLGFDFMSLNTSREPFSNPGLRRAVSHTVDRRQFRDIFFFGTSVLLDTPIPPAIAWAHDASQSRYQERDLARARQELAEAGQPAGFRFAFHVQNNISGIQGGELLAAQLRGAGIQAELEPMEFASLVQSGTRGEHEALRLGWSGSTDPDGALYSLFYSGAAFNLSQYKNPGLDALLDAGRATLDREARASIYREAQQILYDDQPLIILTNTPQIVVSRQGVQNYPQSYNGYWGTGDFDRVWKIE
jgi:peptide/nickel transport system substrate-binding protein